MKTDGKEPIQWKEINIKTLPKKEVLAANFNPGTYGYTEKVIGYIHIDDDGIVCCESTHEIVENCSHYIDINKFDIKKFKPQ